MTVVAHWNNDELRALAGEGRFHAEDIAKITEELERCGTLTFRALESGLFPAAVVDPSAGSGYDSVWVRDNVFVAYACLALAST